MNIAWAAICRRTWLRQSASNSRLLVCSQKNYESSLFSPVHSQRLKEPWAREVKNREKTNWIAWTTWISRCAIDSARLKFVSRLLGKLRLIWLSWLTQSCRCHEIFRGITFSIECDWRFVLFCSDEALFLFSTSSSFDYEDVISHWGDLCLQC